MGKTNQKERAEQLLTTLVECYIREGQPIGSKALLAESSLSVSAATIRNIMAELEERGYVKQPHTSAGRIPTEQAYRLYVDSLLQSSSFRETGSANLAQAVEQELGAEKSQIQLVESASRLLSDMTQMTGLVVAPKREASVLRQVEFLPLSGNRVLVILVMDQQEVENRVIQADREYSQEELKAAANFINAHFVGRTVEEMRGDLLTKMQEDKDRLDELMQTALDVTNRAFSETDDESDVVVSGESNLLTMAEAGSGVNKIKDLFEAFGQKRDILHLLDGCVNADGVQIFIGQETGYSVFDECSLITAPYGNEETTVGVLAVLGPTRMNYERVISTVDLTSKILSSALKRPE